MQSGQSRFLSKLLQGLTVVVFLALFSGAVQAGSVTYTYDSLGRLTRVAYANGVVIVYVYDAAGNRTSYTVTGTPDY